MTAQSPQDVGSDNGLTPSGLQCVLLLPDNAPAPALLVRSLGRRDVQLHEFSDSHLAMAQLCVLARPADGGSLSGRRLMVIIVEPDEQIPAVSTLLKAIDRYLPGATCSAFEALATPALYRIDAAGFQDPERRCRPEADPDEAVVTSGEDRAVQPTPLPRTAPIPESYETEEKRLATGQPQLRLTEVDTRDEVASLRRESEADDGDRAGGSSQLTPEELAMLLADDDMDDDEGRGGR